MEAANTPASDQPVTVIEPVRGWRLPDFREFWRYRDLLVVLARRDIVVRYKQAIFGPGWAVLQPLLVAGMFAFFLGIITDTTEILPDQDLPYGAFAVAGIVLWLAFATGVNMSALSTVMSSMLIEKVYFPRLMIPIAAVAPAAVDMVIGMFVAIAVAIGFGVVPDARVLLAPFVLLLALLLAVGLGIFLSALNVRYRDTTMLVNFVLLAGLFITPITYPYELFVSQFPAALEPIYALNPMVGVLELFRWCLLGTPLPSLAVLAVPFVAAPVFLVAGVLYFERSQRGFARRDLMADGITAEPAIKIEGVTKRYRLGAGYGADATISHRIDSALRAPLRKLRGETKPEEGEDFLALDGVSLEIPEGQMLGLVGANGAGKSTLLKLLARITAPSEGRIEIRGQVGSLLEVGTGFHPELTGRENVSLSGAILGMTSSEVQARYDEIVEFAGIQEFMETPVKRYSSGMFVRLGFAVASHLRPSILLVDEVLAVGDAIFQRKCLDKMQEITHDAGTTVIFVTHNMSWVRRVCDRAIFLESGRVLQEGPASQVVDDYLEKVEPIKHGGVAIIQPETRRSGTGQAKLVRAELSNSSGEATDRVGFGERFTVKATFEVAKDIPDAMVLINVATLEGTRVATNYSTEGNRPLIALKPGTLEMSATIDATLLPGEYVVEIVIADQRGAEIDLLERVLTFTAQNVPVTADGERYPFDTARGAVRPGCEWSVDESSTALGSPAGARAPIGSG